MALAALPRAFKTVMKTLKKIEIIHLCDEMTNINIWVSLSIFSQFNLYFSKTNSQMALTTLPMVSKLFNFLTLVIMVLR